MLLRQGLNLTALEKLNDGQFSWFSCITPRRMVRLGTEWREKGKREGGRWEEAGIHQAVLPAGCFILSWSFLRDAVNKVMPFIPIEAKQESSLQDSHKYEVSHILYIELYILYVFDFAGL